MRAHLFVAVALVSAACGGDTPAADSGPPPSSRACQVALVTDIDETLTTSDEEWILQLADPDHDPAMRPDAVTLMQGYADRGYRIRYVTARGEDMADGAARARTVAWLETHGFPLVDEDEDVVLADGVGAFGEAAAVYKTDVVAGWVNDGWAVAYGYGNSDTDMAAFATVVPEDRLYLVGERAGAPGGRAVPDEAAFTGHLAVLDDVPQACP